MTRAYTAFRGTFARYLLEFDGAAGLESRVPISQNSFAPGFYPVGAPEPASLAATHLVIHDTVTCTCLFGDLSEPLGVCPEQEGTMELYARIAAVDPGEHFRSDPSAYAVRLQRRFLPGRRVISCCMVSLLDRMLEPLLL